MAGVDHEQLVRRGLVHHEARRYRQALPLFERALAAAPRCPNARHNLANTLHCLDRDAEALALLEGLLGADDDALRDGCPELVDSPRALRLDALFLAFRCKLEVTGSWRAAAPLLRRHLRARRRGLRSLWSKAEVLREAAALREAHRQRA